MWIKWKGGGGTFYLPCPPLSLNSHTLCNKLSVNVKFPSFTLYTICSESYNYLLGKFSFYVLHFMHRCHQHLNVLNNWCYYPYIYKESAILHVFTWESYYTNLFVSTQLYKTIYRNVVEPFWFNGMIWNYNNNTVFKTFSLKN